VIQPEEIRSTPAEETAVAVSWVMQQEALSEGNASGPGIKCGRAVMKLSLAVMKLSLAVMKLSLAVMKLSLAVMKLSLKAFRFIDAAVITVESEDILSVRHGFRREGAHSD
jgi:hypothetical protein